MPIDPTIRNRMLELPGDFRNHVFGILAEQTRLSAFRMERESLETAIKAEAVASFPEKSNDTVRKAMIDSALADSADYRGVSVAIQEAEGTIKALQMSLDALRFESAILIAIANNDGEGR